MFQFRESVLPYLNILKICALNSIITEHHGEKKSLKVSKLWAIYSIVVSLAYSGSHVSTVQLHLEETAKVNIVTKLIDYYNRYQGLSTILVCVFVTLYHQKDLIRTLDILDDVDSVFDKNFELKPTNKNNARLPILIMAICIGLLGASEYTNCIMYIQDFVTYDNLCLMTCLVPLYISISTLVQFLYFVSLIRYRLKLINKILRSHKLTPFQQFLNFSKPYKNLNKALKGANLPLLKLEALNGLKFIEADINQTATKTINLKMIQYLIGKLHDCTRLIMKIFQIQIVLILAIQFVTITTLTYFTCLKTIRSSSNNLAYSADDKLGLFGSILWIFLLLTKIFMNCYICQRTKDEANKLGMYLHHYEMDQSNKDNKIAARQISQQVLDQQFLLQPCHFFTLDMSMAFAIVGATTTYVIILIQFDISQKLVD